MGAAAVMVVVAVPVGAARLTARLSCLGTAQRRGCLSCLLPPQQHLASSAQRQTRSLLLVSLPRSTQAVVPTTKTTAAATELAAVAALSLPVPLKCRLRCGN